MKKEVIDRVNNIILAEMEKGIAPWRKPWSGYGPASNPTTGKRYRGINALTLNILAGCRKPFYLTYKQATAAGGKVRKGSKGFPVVFWNFHRIEKEIDGEKYAKTVPFLKHYTVFNIEDCDGLNIHIQEPSRIVFEPISYCQEIVEAMPQAPRINHGGDRAAYNSGLDLVRIPEPETFISSAAYYSTLFHELAHSTGHPTRLNRKLGNEFGTVEYAKEELIAELAASYVCHEAGIDMPELNEQSASYLAGWCRNLRQDPLLFVKSAGKAQRAAEWILNDKPEAEEASEAKPEAKPEAVNA